MGQVLAKTNIICVPYSVRDLKFQAIIFIITKLCTLSYSLVSPVISFAIEAKHDL